MAWQATVFDKTVDLSATKNIYILIHDGHFVWIFAHNSTVLIATTFTLQISYSSIKRH